MDFEILNYQLETSDQKQKSRPHNVDGIQVVIDQGLEP
jgi:hypothetical protein